MWFSEDRSTWERVMDTNDGNVMWKSPISGLVILDPQGRPTIPSSDRDLFWSCSPEWQFSYLVDKVINGPASAGWATERIVYIGLADEEMYIDVKHTLMHLYEGDTTYDDVIKSLRELGVKV